MDYTHYVMEKNSVPILAEQTSPCILEGVTVQSTVGS